MIIGLTGPAGCGKSTIASELERAYGFTRVRFADPLKNMLRALGLSEDEIEGARKETPSARLCGQTPRHAMQTLGTEWGRDHIHPDFWVRAWTLCMNEIEGDVVAEDCRFENEADALADLGGMVVHVKNDRIKKGVHASERGVRMRQGDNILRNCGILDEVPGIVKKFMESLR